MKLRAHIDAVLSQAQLEELAGRLTEKRRELTERVVNLEQQIVIKMVLSKSCFFVMLDNFHYQYSAGFMAEESWDAFRRELRDKLSNDATAAYYLDYGSNFRSSFEELCDQILQEIASDKTSP